MNGPRVVAAVKPVLVVADHDAASREALARELAARKRHDGVALAKGRSHPG